MSGINNHITTTSEAEAEAQEIASTHRIREETRAAVDRYRDEHPARPSATSSSGTLAAEGEEPSNERLAKAGLIGAASGSGTAAEAHLAGNGGEGIDIPDKHGIFSPQLKNERKKVLKVSLTASALKRRKGLMIDRRGDIYFLSIMDVGLPFSLLGINIPPSNQLPSPHSPPRTTRQ
jgi:hypothetical protein